MLKIMMHLYVSDIISWHHMMLLDAEVNILEMEYNSEDLRLADLCRPFLEACFTFCALYIYCEDLVWEWTHLCLQPNCGSLLP